MDRLTTAALAGAVFFSGTLTADFLPFELSNSTPEPESSFATSVDSATPVSDMFDSDIRTHLKTLAESDVEFSSFTPRIPLLALEPPTGLRVDVYSSTALELFWDRVPDTFLTYEVRQDTRSLGITQGTSFFISSNLQPGIEYTFEVIARFDNQPGIQISESAKITATLHNDPNAAGNTPAAPVNTLAAPTNLRIAQYSVTAAELFWDRAPASAGITSYEIYRNDKLLGTTNGISFMDWTRVDGTNYTYAVVAVDAQQQRSPEAVLIDGDEPLDSPGNDDGGFTINADNLDVVIQTFAFVSRGELVNPLLEIAEGLVFGDFDSQLVAVSSEQGNSIRQTIDTYACEGGGSMVRTTLDLSDSSTRIVSAESCAIGESVVSANLVAEQGQTSLLTVEDLTVSSLEAGVAELFGSFTDITGGSALRAVDVVYSESDANGDTSLDFTYSGFESDTEFDVSWSAQSIDGAQVTSISGTTDSTFRRTAADQDYSSGTLVFAINNGQKVTLDAANGDLASFQIDIDAGSTVNSYTLDWSDENRFFVSFGSN